MERRRRFGRCWRWAGGVQPQLAFLWSRVTPGGLGLELTTLLAALSVGLFVLIAYWCVVSGDPGPTRATDACSTSSTTSRRMARRRGEGGHPPGRPGSRCPRRGSRRLHSRRRGAGWRPRPSSSGWTDLSCWSTDQGLDRPPPPAGPARRRDGLVVPERSRRVLDDLRLAGGHGGVVRVRPGISRRSAVIVSGIVLTAADRAHPRVYLGCTG